MPSSESMSSAMEAAVGSLKESLPSDLAPKVDEATQKLENGREGGKQINEARHTLRELRGEVLARAGEFANLLLDELKKNPAVTKEEIQQKVEENPKLTKPQKVFFEKAVQIADEDKKTVTGVRQDLKEHAQRYLEDIYGKGNVPFSPGEIDAGDPKVLGAIIFARRSKVPPKGVVILKDNPVVVELAIKNVGDFNEIYDPTTDIKKAGRHQGEIDKLGLGFYVRTDIKGIPVVPLIAISDDKDAQSTHRHEFGHYLKDLYSRTKRELVQLGRPVYEKIPAVEMVSIEQQIIYGRSNVADKLRLYSTYAKNFCQKSWDRAKDELMADFSDTRSFKTVSQGLMQKLDLEKAGQPAWGHSYYYDAFSPRFSEKPEQAKKIVRESQEEYYRVLTEQINFASDVVSAKSRFGWEPHGEEKFTALMHQYPLPQWKTQMEKIFGKEVLEEVIQIEQRFDAVLSQLDEKDEGGVRSKLELYSKLPGLFLIYQRLKSGLSAGQNPREVFDGVKRDFEKIEKSLGINTEQDSITSKRTPRKIVEQ